MSFRVSPLMKIASSTIVQPAFGSWVTAGAGFTQPCGAPITLTLGTAASSGNDASQMFIPAEPALLIDPSGANFEEVRIAAVLNNTVTLGPKTTTSTKTTYPFTEFPHVAGAIGTGTYIMPKQMLNNIIVVYEDGGTGPWLYIGKSVLFTATLMRIYKLAVTAAGVQPSYWNSGMFSPGNPIDLSELFVLGTINDKYTTSLMID